MAETPLVKKLGIKPGHKLLILNAPDGYLKLLGPLPEGVEAKTQAEGTFDFVQLFVRSIADVENHAQSAMQALKPGGLLWFAYPKKSSTVKTDINRDSGWESVVKQGWGPVTAIAIDDTWSALRFRPNSEVKSRQ